MRGTLVVETRDAADHIDAARTLDLVRGLSRMGAGSTLLLTENGAFNARRVHQYAVRNAIDEGVRICVDGAALAERGIGKGELQDGISVATIESVVDHLIDGSCVIWR